MGFVDDVIMDDQGSSKIDISALVIDLSEQLPDPQPIVRIWGNLIASRGNVSTVVGLAKSRKTFLTAAVASGFLSSSDFLGFDTPATGKVVYIDTEQARAHVHKVARRILRSIGLPTDRNHEQRRHPGPVVGRTRRRRCEFLDSRHLDLRGQQIAAADSRRRGGPLQRSERPARIGGPDL